MSQTRTSLVLLDENSSEQALVAMQDGDRFFVAVAEAAQACQMLGKLKEFGAQFQKLLLTLAAWVDERRLKIKSAHLAIRPQGVLFVVIQKSAEFDPDLSSEMTDLDLSVANSREFELIEFDVLALPTVSAESATAFLSTGHVYDHAK